MIERHGCEVQADQRGERQIGHSPDATEGAA
jgi:hypothetical protein